jgi:hypothetical protein
MASVERDVFDGSEIRKALSRRRLLNSRESGRDLLDD